MTKREAERRERFRVYDDLNDSERAEIRGLIRSRRDFSDVADQFDTDVRTVWEVVFGVKRRKNSVPPSGSAGETNPEQESV